MVWVSILLRPMFGISTDWTLHMNFIHTELDRD